jgi:hypothetical protein
MIETRQQLFTFGGVTPRNNMTNATTNAISKNQTFRAPLNRPSVQPSEQSRTVSLKMHTGNYEGLIMQSAGGSLNLPGSETASGPSWKELLQGKGGGTSNKGPPPKGPDDDRRTILDDIIDAVSGKGAARKEKE